MEYVWGLLILLVSALQSGLQRDCSGVHLLPLPASLLSQEAGTGI